MFIFHGVPAEAEAVVHIFAGSQISPTSKPTITHLQ